MSTHTNPRPEGRIIHAQPPGHFRPADGAGVEVEGAEVEGAVGEAVREEADAPWIDHTWAGRTWLDDGRLIRIAHPAGAVEVRGGSGNAPHDDAAEEAARIEWLITNWPERDRARPPADSPIEVLPGRLEVPAPDGIAASRAGRHPRPDSVPAAIGEALAALHALDPGSCPYERPHAETVAEVSAAIAEDRLDAGLLPSPYDRYPPAELLAMATSSVPAVEPVVGHGSAVLSNLWLDPRPESAPGSVRFSFTGLRYLGVADRHADLAVVHRQLHAAFGPEAVFAFYEGYGAQPALVALDHYLLLDVLRAASVPPASSQDEPAR